MYRVSLRAWVGGLVQQASFPSLSWYWRSVMWALTNFYHIVGLEVVARAQMNTPRVFHLFRLKLAFERERTDAKSPFSVRYSQGFSFDRETALSKCIGEFLERTPFLYYRDKDLLKCSAKEMAGGERAFLDPSLLVAFSPQRMADRGGVPYSDTAPLYWTKGFEWVYEGGRIMERELYIPAQVVYWSYERVHGSCEEPQLREIGTHGGAGYFTHDGAVLRALYEWVGRHLFFSAWFARRAPFSIPIDSIDHPDLKEKCLWVHAAGYRVHLLSLGELYGVQSIFCILENISANERVRYAFGSGCDHDLESACASALEEALSIVFWLVQNPLPESELPPLAKISAWNDKERLNFFQTERGAEQLRTFLGGEKKHFHSAVSPAHVPMDESARVADILTRMKECNGDVRVCYVTAPAPVLNALGFHSVKIVLTHHIPMYHILNNVPDSVVMACVPHADPETLACPHPFP